MHNAGEFCNIKAKYYNVFGSKVCVVSKSIPLDFKIISSFEGLRRRSVSGGDVL